MVSLTSNRSSRHLLLKKALYHPLTWLALGLHALLLVIPLNSHLPATEPEAHEPEVSEEVAVDVLNLSDVATATPPSQKPVVPTSAVPPAAARQAAPSPAAAAAAPFNPAPSAPVYPSAIANQTRPAQSYAAASPPSTSPRASSAASSSAGPVAADSSVAAASVTAGSAAANNSAVGAGSPAAAAPPAYDPNPDRGVFISGLSTLGVQDNTSSVGLPADAKAFRRPDGFGFFINNQNPSNPQPVTGAKDARWLGKPSAELLPMLQSTYAPSNITFTQLDDYGGEPLYELKTAQGQVFMYVSLVELKGSSLLVTWENKPL